MNWIERLLNGEAPRPPDSPRTAQQWDELVLQARSRNGRERQAAVRALASSSHARALPVLLERLNDWVDAVRREARAAVENFLRDDFCDAWIGALDGVAALARGGRADHAATLERIVTWLLEAERFERLRGVRVPRELARLLLRAQLRRSADSPQRLLAWHEALRSTDIVLAADAAQALRESLAACGNQPDLRTQVIALADSALESRFAGIRLTGLRVVLALDDEGVQRVARRMCFDRSSNVRTLAIATLREDDVLVGALRSQASTALASDRPARGRALALETLCALDRQDGLARCRALRDDAAAAVRGVALRHLFAAATADERDGLVPQVLGDPSARVRRIAVAQVHRGASPPCAQALASLALAMPTSLGGVLGVASRLSPWQRFNLLMDLLPRLPQTPGVAEVLRREIGKWIGDMRRCFLAPTSAQKDEARRAWAAGRDLLPHGLQDEAAYHLRSFGVLISN